MLFTVEPPVCVAKYSTKKNTGSTQTDHRPQTDGTGSSLKLNSVYAVKLKNNLECVLKQVRGTVGTEVLYTRLQDFPH